MALRMAFKSLPEKHRLMHHSDRGVQYCSYDYVELLEKQHIRISMTQTGDPLDNAIAERVNGILKSELLENIYPDFNITGMKLQKQSASIIFFDHIPALICSHQLMPMLWKVLSKNDGKIIMLLKKNRRCLWKYRFF